MKRLIMVWMIILTYESSSLSQGPWYQIPQTGFPVSVVSENVGFSMASQPVGSHGNQYFLWKSVDGMSSFSLIRSNSGSMGGIYFIGLSFPDPELGFIAESNQGYISIFNTLNGGANWQQISGSGSSSNFRMFFLHENLGYFLFFPGGNNFSYLMKYLDGTSNMIFETNKYKFNDAEIYFKTDSLGFILCDDSLNRHVTIRTTDGGYTWSEVLKDSLLKFRDICFANDTLTLIIGSHSALWLSRNRGLDWQKSQLSFTSDLNSVYCYHDSLGYIAGDSGLLLSIYLTENAMNYSRIFAPTQNNLQYIRCFGENKCFLIDEQGSLYRNFIQTGIDDPGIKRFRIYPEPVVDKLHIEVMDTLPEYSVCLFNSFGKLILQGENLRSIDFNQLSSGIYFLNLRGTTVGFSQKIIKIM